MNVESRALTHARQWLVQRMHQTYFGTMHNLIVRDGEPVLNPPPKIKQAFKLGGKRNPPKIVSRSFTLKDQHVELFDLMDAKQNGVISKLTIHDGLPFLVEWEAD